MLLSEGQMSDYKGAALMIDALPRAKALLADRGYDADWFRAALIERGITCGQTRDSYVKYDDRAWSDTHARVAAARADGERRRSTGVSGSAASRV